MTMNPDLADSNIAILNNRIASCNKLLEKLKNNAQCSN